MILFNIPGLGQQVQLFKSNNLKKNQSYHNQIISFFKLRYFTLPYSSHCPFCIRINTQPGKPCNRTVTQRFYRYLEICFRFNGFLQVVRRNIRPNYAICFTCECIKYKQIPGFEFKYGLTQCLLPSSVK